MDWKAEYVLGVFWLWRIVKKKNEKKPTQKSRRKQNCELYMCMWCRIESSEINADFVFLIFILQFHLFHSRQSWSRKSTQNLSYFFILFSGWFACIHIYDFSTLTLVIKWKLCAETYFPLEIQVGFDTAISFFYAFSFKYS